MLSYCAYGRNDAARDAHDTVEMLWFAFWALLILAGFKITSGLFGGSLIVLVDGFYSAACMAYVGALLLGQLESMRPADHRYPYGYGNRAVLCLFISLLMLGAASIYMFLRVLPGRGGPIERIDLGTLLTPVASLAVSVLVLRVCTPTGRESFGHGVEGLRAVLKKAVAVSAMALSAVICRALGWGSPEKWGTMLILVITLWVCFTGAWGVSVALMDKSTSEGFPGDILRLVQRASGGASIVDVKTRLVGGLTQVDVMAAFPPSETIARANAIEHDIEEVLRRKGRGIGQVAVHWES